MIYELGFANKEYEIRCEPLSRRSFIYLIDKNKPTNTRKEQEAFLTEFVKTAEAKWRMAGETEWRNTDWDLLPQNVIDGWMIEMFKNEQTKVEITLKQEKN